MTASLIERVESAAEGSRELDGDIHRVLFPDDLIMTDSGSVGPVKRDAVRKPVKEIPQVPGDVVADCMGVAFYTTSLDAALALAERVLPGWGFYLRSDKDGHGAGFSYPDFNRVTPGHVEHKHSLPIALCAAILKAHEASK